MVRRQDILRKLNLIQVHNKYLIQSEQGYALIEVIFLVTVIAILSSIVVPKIAASLQTVQADYFMKTVYSELRFIQASIRITPVIKDEVFDINLQPKTFTVMSNEQNIRVKINSETYREYKMPSGFSFDEDFNISISKDGIFKDLNSKNKVSFNIQLKNNSQKLKPHILIDSVGRLRFGDK